MHLQSSDPDAYAVIHDGRVYPVRAGVFLVPADARGEFPSFEQAGEVSGDVAQELAELGSWPVQDADPVVPMEAAAEPEDEAVEADPDAEPAPEADAELEQDDEQPEEPPVEPEEKKPAPRRRARKSD